MYDSIFDWLKEQRITEVECILPDITGVARGKIIPKDKFMSEPEMRLPEAVLIQTVTGDFPSDDMLDLTDPDMELRPDAATIPIIAMTANAMREDAQRATEAGMNNHIAKPIDWPTLIRMLNHYLAPPSNE